MQEKLCVWALLQSTNENFPVFNGASFLFVCPTQAKQCCYNIKRLLYTSLHREWICVGMSSWSTVSTVWYTLHVKQTFMAVLRNAVVALLRITCIRQKRLVHSEWNEILFHRLWANLRKKTKWEIYILKWKNKQKNVTVEKNPHHCLQHCELENYSDLKLLHSLVRQRLGGKNGDLLLLWLTWATSCYLVTHGWQMSTRPKTVTVGWKTLPERYLGRQTFFFV